ncbi:hypothetical protein [Xylophilus sp. ASV27]|uniref:hypothetical protein n=1 Tax=Xylophilus sp. ASV27 TaxID=2795129 RepID=UPI001E5BB7C8|nr:hypothetical protein [Xylophilus sp. ASV27]
MAITTQARCNRHLIDGIFTPLSNIKACKCGIRHLSTINIEIDKKNIQMKPLLQTQPTPHGLV